VCVQRKREREKEREKKQRDNEVFLKKIKFSQKIKKIKNTL
jgi:hypothetical protein